MGQVVFASYSPDKKCTNGGPETSNPMGKKPATVFYSSGNKNHPPPPDSCFGPRLVGKIVLFNRGEYFLWSHQPCHPRIGSLRSHSINRISHVIQFYICYRQPQLVLPIKQKNFQKLTTSMEKVMFWKWPQSCMAWTIFFSFVHAHAYVIILQWPIPNSTTHPFCNSLVSIVMEFEGSISWWTLYQYCFYVIALV